MRWLIDGYNVMHAGGRIPQGIQPEQFRRARLRFLNDLADTLGPELARETTIVFDANTRPTDFPLDSLYREIHILFALGDESADERIEKMIARHGTPKTLTVVSTDRRIRQAATRRRAGIMTANAYWRMIDDRRERKPAIKPPRPKKPLKIPTVTAEEEAAFWLDAFGELDASPEIQQLSASEETLLTDAEIAQIEREIDAEFKKKGRF